MTLKGVSDAGHGPRGGIGMGRFTSPDRTAHGVPAPPRRGWHPCFRSRCCSVSLLGPVLGHLHPAQTAFLTSYGFFPTLISPAFAQGLSAAFGFAAVVCLIAALASLLDE